MPLCKCKECDFLFTGFIIYFCVNLLEQWDDFTYCSKPLNKWLLIVYISLFAFQMSLLIIRTTNKERFFKVFAFLLIFVVIPFMLYWTI